MPYNRETTVSRSDALVASPGLHSRSGVCAQGVWAGLACQDRPHSSSGSQDLVPKSDGAVWRGGAGARRSCLGRYRLFLAALAIWLSRWMSTPKGRGCDARGPLTGAVCQPRTISCRNDPAIRCKENEVHGCAAKSCELAARWDGGGL